MADPFSNAYGRRNALGADMRDIVAQRNRNAITQQSVANSVQNRQINDFNLKNAQAAQKTAGTVNSLNSMFASGNAQQKTQVAKAMAPHNAKRSDEMFKMISQMDDKQKAEVAAMSQDVAKFGVGLQNVPDEQFKGEYAKLLGKFSVKYGPEGLQDAPPLNAPVEAMRAWVNEQVTDAMTFAEVLDANKPNEGKWGRAQEVTGPDGKPMLVQIETNTGEVRKVDGVGPKAKGNGITVTTGEEGTTVQVGGTPQAQELTGTTKTTVQKELARLEETVGRVANITKKFYGKDGKTPQRQFLTYWGKAENAINVFLDKADRDLTKEERAAIKDYKNFQMSVDREFNAYRKEITGAAASVQELESLKKAVINTDLSPVQFEAALEEYQSGLLRSMRIKRKLLREGMTVSDKGFGDSFDRLWAYEGDDDTEVRGAELVESGMSTEDAVQTLKREGYE